MNTQPLVTLVPWTMIAQFLNLMIQLFLIKKFLFKPVNDILEKRRAQTDQEIRDARQAKEEADNLKGKYEADIAKARDEAARIVQSAQKEAQTRADEVVREAQAKAAGLKAQAEADIAQERKKALNEIKNDISGIAIDIATKVTEREIDEKQHKALIEDFIQKMGDAS